MPVMTRSSLALLVTASVLCGMLVAQTMVQQQTDEQVMLAAHQLVRESQQQLASGYPTGQISTPPDSGLASTSVFAPDVVKKDPPTPLPSSTPPVLDLPAPPSPPALPPPPTPAKNTFKGKALPPGVECNENGICRNVGLSGPKSRETDNTALPDEGATAAASALPPPPPAPAPPSSNFDLPPPPPNTAGALRGAGNHPEAAQCDLKNKDGPENGVIFVDDPRAKALFKDDDSYNLATSEKTGATSSLAKSS